MNNAVQTPSGGYNHNPQYVNGYAHQPNMTQGTGVGQAKSSSIDPYRLPGAFMQPITAQPVHRPGLVGQLIGVVQQLTSMVQKLVNMVQQLIGLRPNPYQPGLPQIMDEGSQPLTPLMPGGVAVLDGEQALNYTAGTEGAERPIGSPDQGKEPSTIQKYLGYASEMWGAVKDVFGDRAVKWGEAVKNTAADWVEGAGTWIKNGVEAVGGWISNGGSAIGRGINWLFGT